MEMTLEQQRAIALASARARADTQANPVADMAKSLGIGAAEGAIGLAGLPGDIRSLMSSATDKIGGAVGASPETLSTIKNAASAAAKYVPVASAISQAPTSETIQKSVEGVTGEFYKPQTTGGEYARTMGQFLPAVAGGPESLLTRLASRVAAPAVASETAGQITKGTATEPYARVGGALVGGALGGLRRQPTIQAGASADLSPVAHSMLSRALTGETPQTISSEAKRIGSSGFVADLNPALTDLAGGIADTAGPAKSVIRGGFDSRAAASRERIERAVTGALGPRQNIATLSRENIQARKEAADPLYEAWRSVKVHPTDEIKSLIPILEEDGLFATARHLMKLEGKSANTNFFTGGDRKSWPTPEAFDYVKQAIDGKISDALAGGNRNVARIYGGLKKRLDAAISNSNPEAATVWKQAREAWGTPTGIMNAREAGQDIFKPSVRHDELLYSLTDMSAPERAAHREGVRDAVASLMDRSSRGDVNARNTLLAPENKKKLEYVINRKGVSSDALTRQLEQENLYASQRTNVVGGSQTTPKAERRTLVSPPPSPILNYFDQVKFNQPSSWLPIGPSDFVRGRNQTLYDAAIQEIAPHLIKSGVARDDLINSILSSQKKSGILGVNFPPAKRLALQAALARNGQ